MRSNFEANRLRELAENVDHENHAQSSGTDQIAKSQHRKSQSLDAATISSQITSNGNKSHKSQHNSGVQKER